MGLKYQKKNKILIKRLKHNCILVFLIIITLFLIVSCGLKDLVYLAPINKDIITGSNLLNYYEFSHNYQDNNIDEFKGYNIYYKFYPEESALISSDITALENIYISTESTITSKGFNLICRKNVADSSFPLINLGNFKNENIRIKIDFIGLHDKTNTEPIITVYKKGNNIPIEEFIMRRNVVDTITTDENKTFFYKDIIAGDKDTNLIASSITAKTNIAVSICVVAYGLDSDFAPIYSEVIFLNRDVYSPLEISYY